MLRVSSILYETIQPILDEWYITIFRSQHYQQKTNQLRLLPVIENGFNRNKAFTNKIY